MRKEHTNHGRDHAPNGMDPIPSRPEFEIFLSNDLYTFTAYPTDPYTDAFASFYIPPTLDGMYLTDAQAFVDQVTSSGDVEVMVYLQRTGYAAYMLSSDGVTASVLTVGVGDRVGSLASSDGILTTQQVLAGDRLSCWVQTTDGVAQGAKVWLQWGEHPVAGANAPVED